MAVSRDSFECHNWWRWGFPLPLLVAGQGCCQNFGQRRGRPSPQPRIFNSAEVEKPCHEGGKQTSGRNEGVLRSSQAQETKRVSTHQDWPSEAGCRLLENSQSALPQLQLRLTLGCHPNFFSTRMNQFTPPEHLSCPPKTSFYFVIGESSEKVLLWSPLAKWIYSAKQES